MNLTCAIIDDEPLAVKLLENYVQRTPQTELQAAEFGHLDVTKDQIDRMLL